MRVHHYSRQAGISQGEDHDDWVVDFEDRVQIGESFNICLFTPFCSVDFPSQLCVASSNCSLYPVIFVIFKLLFLSCRPKKLCLVIF